MKKGAAKTLRLAAMAAGLLFCGLAAGAQESPAAKKLAFYEAAISSGNPAAASAYLRDDEARSLAEADPGNAEKLLGEAEALKDLKDLLNMPWDDASANKLGQALSIRIDAGKPLSLVGVGPEPEKLLVWLNKYAPAYPADKLSAVDKAIRKWDVVFGTVAFMEMKWSNPGPSVRVYRNKWAGMTIRERDAVVENLINNGSRDSWKYLKYDDAASAGSKNGFAIGIAVAQIKNSGALSQSQMAQLDGKSLGDQIYLLGNMFDNSDIRVSPDLKAKINAARSSLPQEVLPSQQRRLLGGMLNTAVARELSGTRAGDRALAAFPGGLRINVAPVAGAYSKYDPGTGAITLDSETIQQYMRMKGYTADSLMRNQTQVAEIAKYMSPAVVYEAAHKMQADWAAQRGLYTPRVQEGEIEAMSLEGLYSNEKLAKDPAFGDIMAGSRDFSSYASKQVEIATEYKRDRSKNFAVTVRQRYTPGMPSQESASAEVLAAVTAELSRRSSMPASDRASLDSTGLTTQDAMAMSPAELAGSVQDMQTRALVKIQSDLSRQGVYRGQYNNFLNQNSVDMKALESGKVAASAGAVPPPMPV